MHRLFGENQFIPFGNTKRIGLITVNDADRRLVFEQLF
jgi:hypothetical protein